MPGRRCGRHRPRRRCATIERSGAPSASGVGRQSTTTSAPTSARGVVAERRRAFERRDLGGGTSDDVGAPRVRRLDLHGVGVDADRREPRVRDGDEQRQADVAETDHRDGGLLSRIGRRDRSSGSTSRLWPLATVVHGSYRSGVGVASGYRRACACKQRAGHPGQRPHPPHPGVDARGRAAHVLGEPPIARRVRATSASASSSRFRSIARGRVLVGEPPPNIGGSSLLSVTTTPASRRRREWVRAKSGTRRWRRSRRGIPREGSAAAPARRRASGSSIARTPWPIRSGW